MTAERRADCLSAVVRAAVAVAASLLACGAFVMLTLRPTSALAIMAVGLPLALLALIGATGVVVIAMDVGGLPSDGHFLMDAVNHALRSLKIK